MQALVLIAHGSRRHASNEEVKNVASRLQHASTDCFQLIETGFLEIAKPSIPEAIESCIAAGATSVVLVPYFLAAGRHVAEDIPRIVQQVAQQHHDVAIHITEHIGMSDSMSRLILDSASSATNQTMISGLPQTG